jgi:transposase
MGAMAKHRTHSAAFKRLVAEEFIASETLHALSKRDDISRQLIRIRVGKLEAGALGDGVQAAEPWSGWLDALEIEILEGALKQAPRAKKAGPPPSSAAPRRHRPSGVRTDGAGTLDVLRRTADRGVVGWCVNRISTIADEFEPGCKARQSALDRGSDLCGNPRRLRRHASDARSTTLKNVSPMARGAARPEL